MSSVLITFQSNVGIEDGLSCSVSTGFKLLLYRIKMEHLVPEGFVSWRYCTLLSTLHGRKWSRVALAET